MFYELSREFGWTPGQIYQLTISELDHYFFQSHRHRNNVSPADTSLERIRQVLFSWLGVKEADSPDQIESKLKEFGAPKVTADEMQAWYDAGMPSPFSGWLKSHRGK